ncbi:MAG TPA: protein translocase subunit SecF [Candidatus Krumholzibacteria bacterium]|nr:protein translocase subunit SecF [Candidatus Krumholzibacteria bacterium]
MQFLTDKHIDFLGKKKIAATISMLLILAGVVSLIVKHGPLLSIDFRGGSIVELRITPAPEVSKVRSALAEGGIKVSQVTTFGGPQEVLIYVDKLDESEAVTGEHQTVQGVVAKALPDHQVELRREETVGPKIGEELRKGATNAIFVSLILIVLYITFRFVFNFGLAAVLTLVHDVLITLGLFSLMNKEISLSIVAAFLTIIGYSLNDTIVVFDRIRENMRLRRKESYEDVVNRSINETLSRTIITSLTTVFVAFILYLIGGAVIHDFAFALTVGIVVGTYSSIYVSSPLVILWYKWRSSDRKRGKRGALA